MSRDEKNDREQPDLFGDSKSSDRKLDVARDLHYDGPITIDDYADDDEDEGGGTGKAFLTAAIVAGVVLIIVGAALIFRDSGVESEGALAVYNRPATVEQATTRSAEEPVPPVDTGAPPADAAPQEIAGYRPVPEVLTGGAPDAPPTSSPPPAAEPERIAASEASPEISRPAPAAASLRERTEAAPAPPRGAEANASASIRELASSGAVGSAAARGAERLQRSAGQYAIQVLVACQPATVSRAYDAVPAGDLWVVPTRHSGQTCYRLLYGTYPDRASADRALSTVPEYFRTEGNTPRPVVLDGLE